MGKKAEKAAQREGYRRMFQKEKPNRGGLAVRKKDVAALGKK